MNYVTEKIRDAEIEKWGGDLERAEQAAAARSATIKLLYWNGELDGRGSG